MHAQTVLFINITHMVIPLHEKINCSQTLAVRTLCVRAYVLMRAVSHTIIWFMKKLAGGGGGLCVAWYVPVGNGATESLGWRSIIEARQRNLYLQNRSFIKE